MKIATYNVNGVNGRLEVLLGWLEEAQPDVVVLQELKAPDAKFPAKAIEAVGYGAVWHGQKSWNGVAILARGQEPHLTRKGLPGEPEDEQSRYIEAIVDGVVIGGLYLPNGNPYPGPKFDYKLRWFQRLHDYAAELLELEVPVDAMYSRMEKNPNLMRTRRCTGEHPFGTIKAWMGSTHFQMRRLYNVRTEMALPVLAYNIKRMINMIGAGALIIAMAA